MTPTVLVWLEFAVCALLITVAGSRLSRYGDVIAKTTGLGGSWIGLVLLASVTSLPELVTGVSSVTLADAPDIAVGNDSPEKVVTVSALRMGALDMAIGNLFGSVLLNVLILAIDDAIYVKGPLLAHVSPLHALSAMSAMIMTGAAMVGLLYRPETRLLKTVGWVSLFLVVVYVMNSYVLYLYGGDG